MRGRCQGVCTESDDFGLTPALSGTLVHTIRQQWLLSLSMRSGGRHRYSPCGRFFLITVLHLGLGVEAARAGGGGLNTDYEDMYRSGDNMAGVVAAKYVTDDVGTRIGVLIGIDDYHKILEDEEELASIRAYDAAKASGDEAIPFEQAVKEIESGSG